MKDKEILKRIEEFVNLNRNSEVQNFIKDKTFPLEQRWDVYTKAVNSGYLDSKESWYFIPPSLEAKGDFTLYDSAYIDKYQTYDYNAFFRYFTQKGRTLESCIELVNKVKEEIMETGSSSWENDW